MKKGNGCHKDECELFRPLSEGGCLSDDTMVDSQCTKFPVPICPHATNAITLADWHAARKLDAQRPSIPERLKSLRSMSKN